MPRLTVDEEAAKLRNALDAIAVAAREFARHQAQAALENCAPREPIRAIKFGDIDVNLTPTKAERFCETLRGRDPVGGAYRVAITVIGQRLFELGGLALMETTLDAVLAAHPECEGWIASVVDHRWDGIGRTIQEPGWCA